MRGSRVSGLARGGAASWTGVTPDVAVYGSALGGGFPIGAVGFKGEGAGTVPGEGRDSAPRPTRCRWPLPRPCSRSSRTTPPTTGSRNDRRSWPMGSSISLIVSTDPSSSIGSVRSSPSTWTSKRWLREPRRAEQTRDAYRRLASGLRDEGVLLPTDPGRDRLCFQRPRREGHRRDPGGRSSRFFFGSTKRINPESG